MINNDTIIFKKKIFYEKVFGHGNVKLSQDKKNFSIRCPYCNKNNGKLKLAVRTIDDLTHCWVCSWKARSLLPTFMKFFPEHLEEYKTFLIGNKLNESYYQGIQERLILPKEFKLLVDLDDRRKYFMYFKYLKDRGITEKDLWRFKFGITTDPNFSNRVIIPSFDMEGELNFFTSRSIFPNKVKYMTCSKDKNEVVFNELYLDYEKPIKICEGPFDMIKCGNNATCLQGSELNEESKLFQEILLNGSKVILCLDNDMKFKTQKIARKLFEYGIEVKVLQIRNANDPGEMNKKELDEQINNNSESFSWHSYMREKINNKILGI